MRLFNKTPRYGPESYREHINNFELTDDHLAVIRDAAASLLWEPHTWMFSSNDIDSITLLSPVHNCRISVGFRDYIVITRADFDSNNRSGIYLKLGRLKTFEMAVFYNMLRWQTVKSIRTRVYIAIRLIKSII